MGGYKYKEAGGGPATGLANDFVGWLQQGLQTGSFGGGTASQRFSGADPIGTTTGITGVLNDILSGGAGKLGGSLNELISKQGERDANAVRARFGAAGGTAFGTPAAYAESLVRSETAPKLATAIGGLQQNALGMLLPLFAQLSGKGIAQREGAYQPPTWLSALQTTAPLIAGGIGLATGNPLAAGAAAGGAARNVSSNYSPTPFVNPMAGPTPSLFGDNSGFSLVPQWNR